jgi:hypothetical protein
MKLTDLYAGTANPDAQPVSQGASTDRNTAPTPLAVGGQAITISWLGVLIALVLLRIVYEVSE